VYGARQALSNPYTGVLAIFGARILNGKRPLLFEDGLQLRDFVHVTDVARALRLALERTEVFGEAINVGSGEARSIAEIARMVASALGRPELEGKLTATCRAGDIRHCFADVSLAKRKLGYAP